MTPSLSNFFLSLIAGGVVAAAIGAALIFVSQFDPIRRTGQK